MSAVSFHASVQIYSSLLFFAKIIMLHLRLKKLMYLLIVNNVYKTVRSFSICYSL